MYIYGRGENATKGAIDDTNNYFANFVYSYDFTNVFFTKAVQVCYEQSRSLHGTSIYV